MEDAEREKSNAMSSNSMIKRSPTPKGNSSDLHMPRNDGVEIAKTSSKHPVDDVTLQKSSPVFLNKPGSKTTCLEIPDRSALFAKLSLYEIYGDGRDDLIRKSLKIHEEERKKKLSAEKTGFAKLIHDSIRLESHGSKNLNLFIDEGRKPLIHSNPQSTFTGQLINRTSIRMPSNALPTNTVGQDQTNDKFDITRAPPRIDVSLRRQERRKLKKPTDANNSSAQATSHETNQEQLKRQIESPEMTEELKNCPKRPRLNSVCETADQEKSAFNQLAQKIPGTPEQLVGQNDLKHPSATEQDKHTNVAHVTGPLVQNASKVARKEECSE